MHKMTNGKAIKFRMLAEQRVSKVLSTIHRIGRLSRRSSYEYSPEQIAKMFTAMRSALDDAEARFALPSDDGQQFSFRLD
jgi:hypothetical protein